MSVERYNGLTTEEQLQDLLVRQEALEQEVNILILENKEYKNEIHELKETNSLLSQEIDSYQEFLEIGQKQISFTHKRLSTMDDMEMDNDDLNLQIKQYKQLLKQLKLENIQLKNENKKYKLALENANESKQKREEIYTNNKLKLENKNKELQQELDALRLDISQSINIYPTISLHDKGTTISKQSSEEKHQYDAPTPYSEMNLPTTPFGILRIRSTQSAAMTPQPTPGPLLPGPLLHGPSGPPSTREANAYLPVFNDFRSSTYEGTDVEDPDHIDDEGMVDCGYSGYKTSKEPSKTTQGSNDDHIFIKQSSTKEYDTDKLLAKIEQIRKLKEISNDQDALIKEYETEIKLLKQQNQQLLDKLDNGFQCIAFKWFS